MATLRIMRFITSLWMIYADVKVLDRHRRSGRTALKQIQLNLYIGYMRTLVFNGQFSWNQTGKFTVKTLIKITSM